MFESKERLEQITQKAEKYGFAVNEVVETDYIRRYQVCNNSVEIFFGTYSSTLDLFDVIDLAVNKEIGKRIDKDFKEAKESLGKTLNTLAERAGL